MLITPDTITEQIITEQYTYVIYANYDVLIKIDCNDSKHIRSEYEGKRILVFLYNSDGNYLRIKDLFAGYSSIHFIIFQHENVKAQISIVFSVSKAFSRKYIEYLMFDYPQIISSESDKELLIELGGCSLYNIYHIMQMCYYNQITVRQIKSQNSLFIKYDHSIDEDESLISILAMRTIGIHRELAVHIIDNVKLSFYLNKQYLFINSDYILTNIYLHLYYKDYSQLNILKIWNTFNCYINDLSDDSDQTIIDQTIWLLQKTIDFRETIPVELGDVIFRIEEVLNMVYRFSNNSKLLEFETLCKRYFQEDKERFVYLLVNEAILYEDIESFDVAKEKFEQALELCDKSIENNSYVFVIDEFSRLLEKTGLHQDALEKLYVVERYYHNKKNVEKLRNVRNRIGLNLCFIGNIRKATSYLERLYFGDFDGKIHADNILSCEVANNLTICYMEAGNYDEALKLQDELYRLYLVVENAPINYATDILQNKGNVYLYQHEYKDAALCFEQALKDEGNPISRELILENYLYAKALSENDYSESIQFFVNQVEQNAGYETSKMLAELYFKGGFFNECFLLCGKLMKEIVYEQNEIMVLSLDILWIKCMIMLKKLTLYQKVKALLRLYKYQKLIQENIGKVSPYYKELQISKAMLRKLKQ